MKIITITNSDRNAVATHGRIKTHAFNVRTSHSGGTTTQSVVVYPADLEYFNGALITSAHVYNAYVDSTSATFGNVKDFEQRFSRSQFVHILDKYVHATAFNRYDFGAEAQVNYPALTTLGDNDLLLIIHAVAAGLAGGGYHHIYHIFLPPGLNYCGTGTLVSAGACNASATSPNPIFCAFHGSVVFSDLGDTLFTLEPYQDTDFCGVDNFTANPEAATPNGLQADSTYSVLSHETSEAITDPDPGTGWFNPNQFYPAEIGDNCAYLTGPFVGGFVQPHNTTLYGKAFRIQFEYSNTQHACVNTPP